MSNAPGPFPSGWPRRVALVAVRDPRRHPWTIDDAFDEIETWLAASGRSVVYRVCQRRPAPDPATYIGRGKAEQLRLLCGLGRIEGVVVDAALTARQRARLETILDRPVLDRGMWAGSGGRVGPDREAGRKTRSLHRVLRRARSCLNVALVGCAGAGKSTLFRALTGGPILPPSHPGGAGTRTRRLRVSAVPPQPFHATRSVSEYERGGARSGMVRCKAERGIPSSVTDKCCFPPQRTGSYVRRDSEATTPQMAMASRCRHRIPGQAPRRPVVVTDTPGLTYDIERDVWTAPPETVEEVTEADLLLHVVDGAHPDALQRRMAVERALRGIGQGPPARMLVVATQCDRTPGASRVTDEYCFPSRVTDECCLPLIAGSAGRRVSGITGVGCRVLAERLIEIAAQADARPVARDIGVVGEESDCLLG